MKKILIIQTAFIGDVILATSFIEQANLEHPDSEIHFLLRKGNESLLRNNPHLKKVWIWDKKKNKTKNLWKLIFQIRKESFDTVYNIQRFLSSGLVTALSGAKERIGFDKNPMSFAFTRSIKHEIPAMREERALHEVERNSELLKNGLKVIRPKLYFDYQNVPESRYLVFAPSSVWFTKQWPLHKWIELTKQVIDKTDYAIRIIGAPTDKAYCQQILDEIPSPRISNLCGQLSLLDSAELMSKAARVFANDSAPLHLASAVNAPTTAIFCSTIKEFGYGPLSDDAQIIDAGEMDCRPCGLHGKKQCPLGHFNCGEQILVDKVFETLKTV